MKGRDLEKVTVLSLQCEFKTYYLQGVIVTTDQITVFVTEYHITLRKTLSTPDSRWAVA